MDASLGGTRGVPDELAGVPQAVLEEYVLQRLRRFAPDFAAELAPHGGSLHDVEGALLRTLQRHAGPAAAPAGPAAPQAFASGPPAAAPAPPLSQLQPQLQHQNSGALSQAIAMSVSTPAPAPAPQQGLTQHDAEEEPGQGRLRFAHDCKYIGCRDRACHLCRNNPNKKCAPDDNFDEAYADGQVLRSKCEAEITVELSGGAGCIPQDVPNVLVQLSVINGDGPLMELLLDPSGRPLLSCGNSALGQQLPAGHVLLPIQWTKSGGAGGQWRGTTRLPELSVVEKTDTFRLQASASGAAAVGSFRLMAAAVAVGATGALRPLDGVAPAVSQKFVVKTQRACSDYRKVEFPHALAKITDLRNIGAVTAARLKADAKQHLGPHCPLERVETVGELQQLVQAAVGNRELEARLVELLNMKGKQRHKWDALRAVLDTNIVVNDAQARLFFPPSPPSGGPPTGLLFNATQAEVKFERPSAIVSPGDGGAGSWPPAVLRVLALGDAPHPATEGLRGQAAAAWAAPGHPGWQLLESRLDYVSNMDMARAFGMQQSPASSQLTSAFSGPGPAYSSGPGSFTGGGPAPYAAQHAAAAAAAAAAGLGPFAAAVPPMAAHLEGGGGGGSVGGGGSAPNGHMAPPALVVGPGGGSITEFEFSALNLRSGSSLASMGGGTVTTGQPPTYGGMHHLAGALGHAAPRGSGSVTGVGWDTTLAAGAPAPPAPRSVSLPPHMHAAHAAALQQLHAAQAGELAGSFGSGSFVQPRSATPPAGSVTSGHGGGGIAARHSWGGGPLDGADAPPLGGRAPVPGFHVQQHAPQHAPAPPPQLMQVHSAPQQQFHQHLQQYHHQQQQQPPQQQYQQQAAFGGPHMQQQQQQQQQQYQQQQYHHQLQQQQQQQQRHHGGGVDDLGMLLGVPPLHAPGGGGAIEDYAAAADLASAPGAGGAGGSEGGAATPTSVKRNRSQGRDATEAAAAAAVAFTDEGRGSAGGGPEEEAPRRPTILYHLESRGRHAPRFRVRDDHDQATAPSHHSLEDLDEGDASAGGGSAGGSGGDGLAASWQQFAAGPGGAPPTPATTPTQGPGPAVGPKGAFARLGPMLNTLDNAVHSLAAHIKGAAHSHSHSGGSGGGAPPPQALASQGSGASVGGPPPPPAAAAPPPERPPGRRVLERAPDSFRRFLDDFVDDVPPHDAGAGGGAPGGSPPLMGPPLVTGVAEEDDALDWLASAEFNPSSPLQPEGIPH
ncbi:MAG: hypothetical protein J3K34DRAFT_515786 [Monoraphidium minutum]|nr:MAG: hypothetical protein J3K34DRAFT_515786 [Monoraphidium minutum]